MKARITYERVTPTKAKAWLGAVVKAWNKRRQRQQARSAATLIRRDWDSFPKFQ